MRINLRTRLTILFISLAILPLIIAGIFTTFRIFATQEQQAIALQQQVAQRVGTQVEAFVQARENELRLLVDIRGLQQLDTEEQRNLLSSLLSKQSVYDELILLDNQGQETIYLSRLESITSEEMGNRSDMDEFKIPQTTGAAYYSSVQFNIASGEPFMTIALPITDLRSGDFMGVLVANFRVKTMWDLMATADVIGSGIVYVVDSNNRVIAHRNPSVVLQGTEVTLPDENGFTTGLDGIDVALAYTTINFDEVSALSSNQFLVVAEQPTSESLALATQSIITSGAAILVSVLIAGVLGVFAARNITRPIENLAETANAVSQGDLSKEILVSRHDEIGVLANAFRSMTARLQQMFDNLERRVDERTEDLALAAEIGQRISQVRDMDTLLGEAVRLIRNRFDLYHVQIYLTNATDTHVVLRAGTGEAGQQMLAAGHQLPIDANSLNGRAAQEKQPVVVPDTVSDPMFKPNQLLPYTHAEAVIPLIVGARVVGVLDLQSAEVNGLSEEMLPALEALAGQLAVAIDGAALFEEQQLLAAELNENSLFLDSVIESLPVMLFVKDAEELRYVRWNQAGTDLVGIPGEEFIGKNDLEFYSQEEAEISMAKDREVLTGNVQVIIPEEPIQTTEKGTRFLRTVKVPIVGADGKAKYLLGISQDITEQKQAEETLARRVAELNCLNEIGRRMEEALPVVEFLEWVTNRIREVMNHPESFMAAIRLEDTTIVGDKEAISQKRHIVEDLQIGNELVGHLYFAYEDESLSFVDEDSSLIGAIGGRLSNYLESQRLLGQLEQQASDLQQVAEIGTNVSTILNPHELIQNFVDLTKSKFGLYHAHIYLSNSNEETEILRLAAGAGDIGRTMVTEKRQIPLHQQQSLVAQAARTLQGVIVNDVKNAPGFLPHPLLPETRSEMAVPLVVFNRLIGVLDVQANEVDAFAQADVSIFTTLATQVAVALQNANQYLETQETLEEVSALQRAMTREGWQAFLTARERPVYGFATTDAQIKPITRTASADEGESLPLQSVKEDERAVIAPVRLGSTSIGSIGVRTSQDSLSEEQQELLHAISEQVGQALERARLSEQMQVALNETETRTEELGLLNEMSQKLTAQTNVDGVLDVAYQYTAQMMATEEFYIAFYYQETDEVEFALTMTKGKPRRYTERRQAGEGLTEYIIRNRQPLLMSNNVDQHLKSLGIAAFGNPAESWVGVPLNFSGKVIGVMALQSYEMGYTYSEQHLNLLTAIASQATIAVENARLIEATTARAEEEQMLRQISARVNTAVDAESILRTAAEEIGRVLGLEGFVELKPVGSDNATNGRHGTNDSKDHAADIEPELAIEANED